LGDKPAHVQVHVDGYEVSGVRADGTSEDAIELRKLLQAAEKAAVSLPPWFSVTRSFEFANEFRVTTTITRETATGTPQLVHLPLLANEAVHDARVQVREHSALLAFGPDDTRFEFTSTLAPGPQVTLTAAPHATYSERWQFACGSMWECAATGVVPVSHEAEGRWQPQYRPWPGEQLTLALTKPSPAPGQTTTIDSVELTVRPGVRATDGELHVSMRTSRGGDHKLYLPAHARVRSFSVAGAQRSTQRDGDGYGFSVLPGRSDIAVQFELPSGFDTVLQVPQVKLDTRARNARVVVEAPAERWLLWARGPAWGPAILFWGYLLLVLAVAVVLGRLRQLPLRTWDWLLLALGLTQISPFEAVCVVGFFLVIQWRATSELGPWQHNWLQMVLVIWACVFSGVLFDAVHSGLLVSPDMQVTGAGSQGNTLRWYVDDSGPELPRPVLISVPIWVYRVLMLVWSLWLARKLLIWAPWAFRAFSAGGLWKKGKLPFGGLAQPRGPVPPASVPGTPGAPVAPAAPAGVPPAPPPG
jgi:hypothetical protein